MTTLHYLKAPSYVLHPGKCEYCGALVRNVEGISLELYTDDIRYYVQSPEACSKRDQDMFTYKTMTLNAVKFKNPIRGMDREAYFNSNKFLKDFRPDDLYLVLGQVSTSKHYVVANLSTGKIVPRMWHDDDFEMVSEDEI